VSEYPIELKFKSGPMLRGYYKPYLVIKSPGFVDSEPHEEPHEELFDEVIEARLYPELEGLM
jgi:hypothetical protein